MIMKIYWAHTILAAIAFFIFSLMLHVLFRIIDQLLDEIHHDDDF